MCAGPPEVNLMAVINKETRAPVSEDVKEQNRGKWIAIRGDEVIASAESLDELIADERVKALDAVYRVPTTSTYFY
jgi:hypothetical protein